MQISILGAPTTCISLSRGKSVCLMVVRVEQIGDDHITYSLSATPLVVTTKPSSSIITKVKSVQSQFQTCVSITLGFLYKDF